jgi:hypothetical protein
MLLLLRLLIVLFSRFFRSRRDLVLENLAVRQQPGVFKQKNSQPRFAITDKLFWVMLGRLAAGFDRSPTADCRALALDRLWVVLDLALAASDPSGKKGVLLCHCA